MAKSYNVVVGEKELRKLADDVKAYKKELEQKTEEIVRKLAEVGASRAREVLSTPAPGDSTDYGVPYVGEIKTSDGTCETEILWDGEDVAFVEFGSGIHYNGSAGESPNPLGGELGYTIGSYGKGHGAEDSWYYVKDAEDEWSALYGSGLQESFGTKAEMPLYKAELEIIQNIETVAEEVFGG